MKLNRLHYDVFKQLLSVLAAAKVSPELFLSEARSRGFSAPESGEAVFFGPEAMVLLETAAILTGDPCLAIHLGQKIGIESYGTFGFALMSCANQRDSIRLLERYGKVFFDPSWKSYEHKDGLLLRMNLERGTPAQQQLVTELCFSLASSVEKSLHKSSLEGVEVHLAYPEPPHAKFYKTSFATPVIKFNCEYSQVFLPANTLDAPVRSANPAEHVVFHQQCEEMLRTLDQVEDTTARVRRLLIQSAGQFLNITQIAELLHVSERTLRRRLDDEATSFKAILEEIKNLLATEYLTKTRLTVAEIAYLLDYAETGNFRRAFVRLNGVTPSDYRHVHIE